ncbi:MAG: class I SAM-dependent methyltransferase [Chitinophagia bacterium]|nr:class I SAM-dependent methyltransferase [Chitinophagia bacterium]
MITFIENDTAGGETLEAISNAHSFNRWMYETIRPFLASPVIEIGSGIGNISELLLHDDLTVQLTDIRTGYCKRLEERFSNASNLMAIEKMDLVDPDFESRHSADLETYRSAFALNVVEHIEDDRLALRNCHKLLQKGGRMIVLVPSYPSLYNRFDVALGHYRRYTLSSLSSVFKDAGFRIVHKQYFNLAGIPGWFLNGKILGKEIIPAGQMKLFDRFVPIFKLLDSVVMHSAGLSTIVVGEKI